jgi:CheY-like chemotaxis protein
MSVENKRTTPQKILVVDDEPDLELLILQRFRRSIRNGEFEFLFAHNGVEALEKLRDTGTSRWFSLTSTCRKWMG